MQPLKANHSAISAYLNQIADYDARAVAHETGRRFAFQRLLEETCKAVGWAVTAEESINIGGKVIRPDAILERNAIPRGYWEAKDHSDDLETEIRKKTAAGYPTNNIIFEDTRRAVLFQNHARAADYDLTKPADIADLLNAFYSHSEPDFVSFDQALQGFKERVGELGSNLKTRIEREYRESDTFHKALDNFLELCKRAIGESIDRAEVITMLIQHLLTERLIRRLFDNPDFARRNAIAAEIEKVIDALTSHSFSREEYLKDLGRYYEAIEGAAHGLDFNQKQKVLNEVYEAFFQGYAPEQADMNGIVYTPRPIVDFMCDSVIQALGSEFGLKLDSPEVVILDPATGTGNFVVQLLARLPKATLPEVYEKRLFANEIMLMPYYIAALNIEHAYFNATGDYKAFEGLCYVDTLSLQHGKQRELFGFSERNDQRIERQGAAPVTVIIGNPPYNIGQQSENDNNKNKKYQTLDKRIHDTYAKDSTATLRSKLYDAYVKFFRWASDRLQKRDGIVCYVSNNSFIDQIAFDGMRKHLLQDFTQVYHIDLHGDVRQNPKLSGTTHNVFGIQVGVGITVAIKHSAHAERRVFYTRVPEDWRKEQKLTWLRDQHDISKIPWQTLIPDAKNRWLVTEGADEFSTFMPIGNKETRAQKQGNAFSIFATYSAGVNTSRDSVVYDFDAKMLRARKSITSRG